MIYKVRPDKRWLKDTHNRKERDESGKISLERQVGTFCGLLRFCDHFRNLDCGT